MLASPLLTLFANTMSFTEATHILSLFILDGEEFMTQLIFNIFKSMQTKILSIHEEFDLQAYISKPMYDDAFDQGLFYNY